MQPPATSAVRAPDPSVTPLTTLAPRDLIAPPEAIFDAQATAQALDAALADLTEEAAIRAATVGVLSRARRDGMAVIAAAFQADPLNSRPAKYAYAWLTDRIVEAVTAWLPPEAR